MSPMPLGILAAAGFAEAAVGYDLLQTVELSSSATSISFQNLSTYSANYRHLEVRYVAQSSRPGQGADVFRLTFNNDSGTNYNWRRIDGSGSSVTTSAEYSQDHIRSGMVTPIESGGTDNFAGGVIQITDAFSNSKYKNAKILSGMLGASKHIRLQSGIWLNSNSITEINLDPFGDNLLSGTTISLYGIKAA